MWDRVSDTVIDAMVATSKLDAGTSLEFERERIPGKLGDEVAPPQQKPNINIKKVAGGRIPQAVRRYLKASPEVQAEWDREANEYFGEGAKWLPAIKQYVRQVDYVNRHGRLNFRDHASRSNRAERSAQKQWCLNLLDSVNSQSPESALAMVGRHCLDHNEVNGRFEKGMVIDKARYDRVRSGQESSGIYITCIMDVGNGVSSISQYINEQDGAEGRLDRRTNFEVRFDEQGREVWDVANPAECSMSLRDPAEQFEVAEREDAALRSLQTELERDPRRFNNFPLECVVGDVDDDGNDVIEKVFVIKDLNVAAKLFGLPKKLLVAMSIGFVWGGAFGTDLGRVSLRRSTVPKKAFADRFNAEGYFESMSLKKKVQARPKEMSIFQFNKDWDRMGGLQLPSTGDLSLEDQVEVIKKVFSKPVTAYSLANIHFIHESTAKFLNQTTIGIKDKVNRHGGMVQNMDGRTLSTVAEELNTEQKRWRKTYWGEDRKPRRFVCFDTHELVVPLEYENAPERVKAAKAFRVLKGKHVKHNPTPEIESQQWEHWNKKLRPFIEVFEECKEWEVFA